MSIRLCCKCLSLSCSWRQMMHGSALTASRCSRGWWRWAYGPCLTSSFCTWSVFGRWANGETSSLPSSTSLWALWIWLPMWWNAVRAWRIWPHGLQLGNMGILTSFTTCMQSVTTMEACMEAITQVSVLGSLIVLKWGLFLYIKTIFLFYNCDNGFDVSLALCDFGFVDFIQ